MKLVILVVVLIVAQSSVESKNNLVVLEQKNGASVRATIKVTKSTIAQKIFDLVYKETGIKMRILLHNIKSNGLCCVLS